MSGERGANTLFHYSNGDSIHNDGGNMLMADGHAKWYKWGIVYYGKTGTNAYFQSATTVAE